MFFKHSGETTWCGMGAGVGFLLVLLGLLFDQKSVWDAGIAIVAGAAALLGVFARSERQHVRDLPEVQQEARTAARDEVSHPRPPENV